MPLKKKQENSSNGLKNNPISQQSDDSNTLHEQLKKIKEDSNKLNKDSKDIDHPIYEYCS